MSSIEGLYNYCESIDNSPKNIKNKASAYEYLIKRYFESYFDNKTSDYTLNLFPIIGDLTPDMELSLNSNKIIIVIEIKYYESLSSTKKDARTKSRQQMNSYIEAYKENFPDATVIPLFVTQNSEFDNNPNKYPCAILPLRDPNKVDLETIIQEKVEKYSKDCPATHD